MREAYDLFQREMGTAVERYQNALKAKRTGNWPAGLPEPSDEELQAELLSPVIQKWQLVPGFGGSASVQVERMRQEQDAREAAADALEFQRQRQSYNELVASQADPEQALRQSLLGSQRLVYSGRASPLLQALREPPRPAERSYNVTITGDETEPDLQGFQPGVYRRTTREGEPSSMARIGPLPNSINPESRTRSYRLDSLTDELKALKKKKAAHETVLSYNPRESQITEQMRKDVTKWDDDIKALEQQIEELLGGGGKSPSATTNAPASKRIGRFTVTR
jgi:hypothetical protein